jgi:hypothetical protein
METKQIREAAVKHGALPQALDEVTRQVLAHFGDGQPRPADVEAFIVALPVWTKVGMEKQEFLDKPHTWRIDQARVFEPAPAGAHPRRPVTRVLSPAELAGPELAGLTGAAHTEKARAMQQTPAPAEEAG